MEELGRATSFAILGAYDDLVYVPVRTPVVVHEVGRRMKPSSTRRMRSFARLSQAGMFRTPAWTCGIRTLSRAFLNV